MMKNKESIPLDIGKINRNPIYKAIYELQNTNNQNTKEKLYKFLFNEYHETLYYRSVKVLKNHEDAQDNVVISFQKAFNKIKKFNFEYKFSTWLFKININNAIDSIRKKTYASTIKTVGYDHKIDDNKNETSPEEKLINNEIHSVVIESLKKIPKQSGNSVQHKIFDNMKFHEVANEMQISENGAKTNFYRGLRLLSKDINLIKLYSESYKKKPGKSKKWKYSQSMSNSDFPVREITNVFYDEIKDKIGENEKDISSYIKAMNARYDSEQDRLLIQEVLDTGKVDPYRKLASKYRPIIERKLMTEVIDVRKEDILNEIFDSAYENLEEFTLYPLSFEEWISRAAIIIISRYNLAHDKNLTEDIKKSLLGENKSNQNNEEHNPAFFGYKPSRYRHEADISLENIMYNRGQHTKTSIRSRPINYR